MDFSVSSLIAGFVFGVVGVYFIKEAKRLGNLTALCYGLALLVYPYFVSNPWFAWPIGVALTVIGYKQLGR